MNSIDEVCNNHDNLLTAIRDYTSCLGLCNTSDHTIDIAQPAGTEVAEMFARLRELTSRELGTRSSSVTPAAERTSAWQQPAVHNP